MVRDIGINGTFPVASNSLYTERSYQSPGVASGADLNGNINEKTIETGEKVTGAKPLTAAQQNYAKASGKITDTGNPDYYDPRLGNVSSSAAVSPDNIPSGVAGGSGTTPKGTSSDGPLTGGTTTNSTARKTIPPAPAKYIGPF
jgi:hypothetical protein